MSDELSKRLKTESELILKKELEVHKKLGKKFDLILPKPIMDEGFTYHLGDIYGACLSYVSYIDTLIEVDYSKDKEFVEKLLYNIQNELYEHLLPNHLKPLRGLIWKVIDEIDDENEEQIGNYWSTMGKR